MGDFNIHICCKDQSLVKDVFDVIDCFNLNQFVTNHRGRTLDLVLGYGLYGTVSDIYSLPVLDHLAVF